MKNDTLYRSILKKYIRMVRAAESVDYIESHFRYDLGDNDFTETEWEVLISIAKKTK